MKQQRLCPDNIRLLRHKLEADAKRAKDSGDGAGRQEWGDPGLWSQYMGRGGDQLYASFTDEELLDRLRVAADELGHVPAQKEIFCVYRSYIRRRFTNWPTALRAAGLKAPKKKSRTLKQQRRP
jgi:hypothetical protein